MSKSKPAKLRASSRTKTATTRKRPNAMSPIEKLAAPHEPAQAHPLDQFFANFAAKRPLFAPPYSDPRKEMVAHPEHYNRGGIECMQVSAAMVSGWSPQAAYRLGQAHDYIFRHAHKGQPIQDLEKSVFWIQEHIKALKAEAAAGAAS